MALTGSGDILAASIYAALGIGTDANLSTAEKAQILQQWKDISAAIVGHIVTNAVIPIGQTVSVDPMTHSGFTTGPGMVA